MPTVVDSLYEEHGAVTAMLSQAGEPSLQVAIGDNYRKALLLASASFFEHSISETLTEYVHKTVNGDERLVTVFYRKAIERQYFTYFDWKGSNCNSFFSFFGPTFKSRMSKAVASDEGLQQGVTAFLELGRLRNELVHQNFAKFALDKTAEEIYELYKKAVVFVDRFRVEFGCLSVAAEDPGRAAGAGASPEPAPRVALAAEPVAEGFAPTTALGLRTTAPADAEAAPGAGTTTGATERAPTGGTSEPPGAPSAPGKKPWWKFWQP